MIVPTLQIGSMMSRTYRHADKSMKRKVRKAERMFRETRKSTRGAQ